ncbi:MAG: hypothetical protein K9H62_23040 [Bacteroidales bacterium]|nr:hypothetical protein [Bacteroidales bacterium]
MAIALTTDLYIVNKPLEVGGVIGTGLQFEEIAEIPSTVMYAGKIMQDVDNGKTYRIDDDGVTASEVVIISKADHERLLVSASIVNESFTGIEVLTQAEYDLIAAPTETVLYMIKPAVE